MCFCLNFFQIYCLPCKKDLNNIHVKSLTNYLEDVGDFIDTIQCVYDKLVERRTR